MSSAAADVARGLKKCSDKLHTASPEEDAKNAGARGGSHAHRPQGVRMQQEGSQRRIHARASKPETRSHTAHPGQARRGTSAKGMPPTEGPNIRQAKGRHVEVHARKETSSPKKRGGDEGGVTEP